MEMKGVITRIILITLPLLMVFASAGFAEERKVTVEASELPAVIKAAIKGAFPNGKILKIEKEVEGEDPGQYDVFILSGGKVSEVEISPAGQIIEIEEKKTAGAAISGGMEKKWTDSFGQENCTFSSRGRNSYFILTPGHQLVLESSKEKVVITVLDETKRIGGIETRVVEEREQKHGKLVEVSRNFFATCKEHGDVFYFGEEVDDYKDGKIVNHGGEWRADEKDSKAGMIMPGTILLGARHYQEIAPTAMDRAEIVGIGVSMKTSAGKFRNCIRVEETSGLDPNEKCYKTYAPGVGIIQDEDLLLTSYSTGKEVKVSLADLPTDVRVAIEKHAAGGKIIEIEKDIVKGKPVYEAEVIRGGREVDILVSAAGKLLCIKEEAKDHHDEDDEDKDEDDEDKDEDDED